MVEFKKYFKRDKLPIELEEKLEKLKSKTKDFKKCAKTFSEGLPLAEELKILCIDILKHKELKESQKVNEEINKVLASINLYILNATNILQFKEKWEK